MPGTVSSQICQRGVVENSGGGVAHIKHDFIEGAVLPVRFRQLSKRVGVAHRGQRAIDGANDLAQKYLGGIAPQQIPAVSAAKTINDPDYLEIVQNSFEKLFRDTFRFRDLMDPDWALGIPSG